ncbi:MAG: biotin synthase BioB [Candidatus Omnitrophica bacterium]|nr:biotin synthase BioB [Candidatus Omnitrophota bacterium]
MNTIDLINDIKKRILQGGDLTFDEAMSLIEIKDCDNLEALFMAANKIREKFRGNRVDLCSITNAKSGNCSQDCAFCAQSAHSKTEVNIYPLISAEEIVERAKEACLNKSHRFCIVTSGCFVEEREFQEICKAIRLIKENFPSLKMDASLGKLTKDQACSLKEAGLDRYNHNIETVESFFSKICTTHTFQDRLETLKILKEVGIEICCGGIIGLGETNRQRIEFAFYLKDIDVDCVPINFLNPVKGTSFQDNNVPPPLELLKIISIFRLILPKKQIRICGGRERNLRELQSQIFFAGADAIILGNYLTTKGDEPHQDLQMIYDLGLKI